MEEQEGMALRKLVYELTTRFPNEEKCGLAAALRRAAEVQARHGTREFLLFLSHAEGSLTEVETIVAGH